MDQVFSNLVVFAEGLGCAAVIVLAHSELLRALDGRPRLRDLALGLLFGCGAIASMNSAVVLSPGVIIDARGILVGLAAVFGGPIACLVAAFIAGLFRLWLGGAGAVPGVTGITLDAIAGVVFVSCICRDPVNIRFKDLVIIAAMISLNRLTFLLEPATIAAIIRPVLHYYIVSVFLGVILLGSLLKRGTRRLRVQAALVHAAMTDPLTDLYNRRAFNAMFGRDFVKAQQSGQDLTMLFLDIDRFKSINDTYGHDIGDEALQVVGAVLRKRSGPKTYAARLGGDEFVVCLIGAKPDEASAFAAFVVADIKQARIASGIEIAVSIGQATCGSSQTTRRELLKAADRSLYLAKTRSQNRAQDDSTTAAWSTRARYG